MASELRWPLRASTFCLPGKTLQKLTFSAVAGAAVVIVYAATVLGLATLSAGAVLGLGFALVLIIELLRRYALPDLVALVLAWAPLHLLVLGTGSLASPAIPLAAAWVVAVGAASRVQPGWAALAAAMLLIAPELLDPDTLETGEVLRLLLLLALAASASRFFHARSDARAAAEPTAPAAPARRREEVAPLPPAALSALLEVVRQATGASEAAIWRGNLHGSGLHPVAVAGATEAPQPILQLEEGHPYSWALLEQRPIHLERGRKPLPRSSANEMLLLPLDDGNGLLTLAYDAAVPVGGEEMALTCGTAVEELYRHLPEIPGMESANLDALTGLPDRDAFAARLASVCASFQRYARPFSVIVLDIDHFKLLNDRWGHAAGDRMLQHVAALLGGSLREVDLAARFGGEEFVLVLPETHLEDALAVAERVRHTLEEMPMPWNGHDVAITASFGVAACPECCAVATDTLAAAESALFNSKRTGRNRVSAATPPA
jgi:diguanylate cyclase (GGDEF)-like protein